jgi:hypothetical protein
MWLSCGLSCGLQVKTRTGVEILLIEKLSHSHVNFLHIESETVKRHWLQVPEKVRDHVTGAVLLFIKFGDTFNSSSDQTTTPRSKQPNKQHGVARNTRASEKVSRSEKKMQQHLARNCP